MKISRFFLLILLLTALTLYNGGTDIIEDALTKFSVKNLPFMEKRAVLEIKDADLDDSSDFYETAIYSLLFIDDAVQTKLNHDNYTPLRQIAPSVRQAIIATEDARFYEHTGVDLTGIARAALVNLQYGQIEEGASTITQQLAKNLFLSPERSFGRKLKELLFSLRLETAYDKDELLEFYLNTIYFGSGYYGIGDAAAGYFGKTPAELSPAESAMLAGLPNAPSLYSPYVDFKAAKARQAIVTSRLQQLGYISNEDAEALLNEPIWLAH